MTKELATQPKKTIAKPKKQQTSFVGARVLMSAPDPRSKEYKAWRTIQVTAKALNISPFGVNILGDLPYINKLGLATKAHEYDKGIQFKYEWVEIAKTDTDKAICKCTILDSKGRTLADGILGECSPSTIRMSTHLRAIKITSPKLAQRTGQSSKPLVIESTTTW
jgi:hypothetical protein